VDFEILNTEVIEGGFKIFIAIFTNQNQYLVYETETTIMANLKTLSKTSLLYSKQSSESVLRILSSFNGYEDESKAVVLVLTEEDPVKYKPPAAPPV
jgi:hypothetical protein